MISEGSCLLPVTFFSLSSIYSNPKAHPQEANGVWHKASTKPVLKDQHPCCPHLPPATLLRPHLLRHAIPKASTEKLSRLASGLKSKCSLTHWLSFFFFFLNFVFVVLGLNLVHVRHVFYCWTTLGLPSQSFWLLYTWETLNTYSCNWSYDQLGLGN